MNKHFAAVLAAWLAFIPAAYAGTIFVDTGGLATNSGSTDANSPTTSGTAATNVGTTVTLDVSTNLGTVNTSGPNQTSINIAGATNTNRTIFWVTSVTSGCTGTAVACVIVVDTAPTGLTTNAWSVGGRYLWPSGSTVDKAASALRGGDTLQFNNPPATRTAAFLTLGSGQVGDSTNGNINIIGKAGGSRILLDVGSSPVNVLTGTGSTSNYIYLSNLELRQAATTVSLAASFGIAIWDNVKFNHPSGTTTAAGMLVASASARVLNSEFVGGGAGTTQDCINVTGGQLYVLNSYLHNCNGDGVEFNFSNPISTINGTIIANNGSSGINLSGATVTSAAGIVAIENSTIYSNGVAGLTVADADTMVFMENNIFQNDGTHPNVSWTAGNCSTISYHSFNVFYASGGTNLNNCSANATEFTTNPLFNNAGGADWSISNSSPAAGSGIPGNPSGSSSTGFRDMGAIQRQVTAGGGGGTQVFGQ